MSSPHLLPYLARDGLQLAEIRLTLEDLGYRVAKQLRPGTRKVAAVEPVFYVRIRMSRPSQRKPRRLGGAITTPLEVFRRGEDGVGMRDALAQLAMRLIDAEDRQEFRKADGVTTLVDHLARILEEQATRDYAWQTSDVFGTTWTEFEVHDSLQFTLVALCHASIDAELSGEMHDLGVLTTFLELLRSLPPTLDDFVRFVLEASRNLCCATTSVVALPGGFVRAMWDELLLETKVRVVSDVVKYYSKSLTLGPMSPRCAIEQEFSYRQELATEVLCNLAAIDPTVVDATPERLSTSLTLFLEAVVQPDATNFGVALADLLCNVCSDPAQCLLLICELDTRRPPTFLKHSGAVYLAELAEHTHNDALKLSMEALVHNLSWSDAAGKRTVQKLALSSFMELFALEPAINN